MVAVSCGKIDEIPSLIDRVTVLEGKVSSIEDAIAALQNAVDSKYAVESYEKTDNGYILHFTNEKTIELTNGKDGQDGAKGDKGDKGDTGAQGAPGQDDDTLIKSFTDAEDSVIIALNDEHGTTFALAKAVKILIGQQT